MIEYLNQRVADDRTLNQRVTDNRTLKSKSGWWWNTLIKEWLMIEHLNQRVVDDRTL